MGALTKLAAVNRILRGSAENPVTALAVTTNESFMAEDLLDDTVLQHLTTGFHCNTLTKLIELDGNSKIPLPDETLTVMGWFDIETGQVDTDQNLRIQDETGDLFAWDIDNDTDVFDKNLVVRITVNQAFVDLPTPIQFMITDEAAAVYQMITQGDERMNQLLSAIALQSRIRGRAFDIRSSPHNAFANGRDSGPRQMNLVPRRWR